MSDGITDMSRDYDDDDFRVRCIKNENNHLKSENEGLKAKLIDLTFEMNYNKQNELIEFIREIYDSIKEETETSVYDKSYREEILFSLKKNIEEFVKNNKILL